MFLLFVDTKTEEHKIYFYQALYFHTSLMSFCSSVKKNSSLTDKFLLSVDTRTKEQMICFYQTFYSHISLLFFCSSV